MKLHIITVGSPKLQYAKLGWEEYLRRLKHYYSVSVIRIADKHNDAAHILAAIGSSYAVGLVIQGQEFSSPELAQFMDKRANDGRQVSFIIGGPDGLPPAVMQRLNLSWSFGALTYPHDLAMIMLLESLYRAGSINAGQPYHH